MRRMFSRSRHARSITVGAVTALAMLAASLTGCTSHSTAVDTSSAASASSAAAESSAAAAARAQAAAQVRAAALKAQAAEAAAKKAAVAKAAAAKAAVAKAAAAKAAAQARAARLAKIAKAAKQAKLAAAAKAAKAAKRAKLAAAARAAKAAAAKVTALAAAALRFDPLTGGIRSKNPVIAVKIDNTSAGRPQFGIADADVVYVEQVEGGLTRLIGLFHTRLPTEVGPVRSVRSTDAELLPAYGQPLLAFSGGAGGPLAKLAASSVINGSGGAGYWRSSAKPPPYNLHVNLQQLSASVTGEKPARSPGFVFGTNYAGLKGAMTRSNIKVVMEAGTSAFQYNKTAKVYRVQLGNTPAVDAAGRPLVTKNVLVQHVTDSPDGTADSNGQPSLLSQTTGKGDFTLYRNGKAIHGRWFRFQVDGPTKYLDKSGKPILFDRGTTWVTLAPQTSQVTDW